MVRLVDVRRIDYDGRHNAFTDLAAWRGQYYLTFRLGTSHKSRDGRIVLLQSSDLSNWSEAKVIATGADDRDPKLLPTERRLFL